METTVRNVERKTLKKKINNEEPNSQLSETLHEQMKLAYSIKDYAGCWEFAKQLDSKNYEDVEVYKVLSLLHQNKLNLNDTATLYHAYNVLVDNLEMEDVKKAILYNKNIALMFLKGKWQTKNGDIISIDEDISITFSRDDSNEEVYNQRLEFISTAGIYALVNGKHTAGAEEATEKAVEEYPYNGSNSEIYKIEPYTWLRREIEKIDWGIINSGTEKTDSWIEIIDDNNCKYNNYEKKTEEGKIIEYIHSYELTRA